MSAPSASWLDLRLGDALTVLRTLPERSVNCCVTSPPYWGLRDYDIEPTVWGGDPEHGHVWQDEMETTSETNYVDRRRWQHTRNGRDEEAPPEKRVGWRRSTVFHGRFCTCGAWLGTLGLEPTPTLYVAHLVDVLREVRRVLRDDGTLWLNLGDSYSAAPKGPNGDDKSTLSPSGVRVQRLTHRSGGLVPGLKTKDLVGTPWAVAFALRDDGWWLRSDIIWSKPNPMPESVGDRPTKAHEYLFLLAKSERYFYDADAIREPDTGQDHPRNVVEPVYDLTPDSGPHNGIRTAEGRNGLGRNKRSVWEIPVRPFADAHFATFPTSLVSPCVLAGCPEGGTVLDPFLGSGTTALVASQLGRRALGIDANPLYLEMARKRCNQATVWEAVTQV